MLKGARGFVGGGRNNGFVGGSSTGGGSHHNNGCSTTSTLINSLVIAPFSCTLIAFAILASI
jgi:hypothetical protein